MQNIHKKLCLEQLDNRIPVAIESQSFFLLEYKKPIQKLTLSDINKIIDIIKCHSIKISIPEINQFSEGH
jgi:hypothetical protein